MASELMLASYDNNGEFRSVLGIDPSGALFLLGNTGTHALIGNYSSSGALLDAYIYGGQSGDAESGYSIAVNSQDQPVVEGDFNGDADFDPSLETQIEN